MYTSPGAVGYENSEIQDDTYQFAITGVLPISGKTSILDVGAGRGDLYEYLKRTHPALDIEYFGVEQNELLVKVGNDKLEKYHSHERNDYPSIRRDGFLETEFIEGTNFDHVFFIGTLNLFYGWENEDWTHIELMLAKALGLAKHSVTMILIHDNGGWDMYKSFPIPNMTDLILKFNCSFDINFDNETGIYKLTVKL